MDKSREDFEQWFKSDYHPDKAGPCIKDIMCFAWQASRKALVVTLPEVCAFNLCDLLDKKEVIEHVRAAGITVKGEGDDTQSQNSA